MNPFKLFYVVMLLLLVGGIGGALQTPLGGDERVGNIAAGFSIGLLFSTVGVRLVQLRVNSMSAVGKLDFHGLQTGVSAPSVAVRDQRPRQVQIVDVGGQVTPTPVQERTPPSPQPIVSSADTEPYYEDQQYEDYEEDGDYAEPAAYDGPVCSCVCDCERPAQNGFEGMCSECRAERLENMLVCDCDQSTTQVCTCGALKHWPHEDESSPALAS